MGKLKESYLQDACGEYLKRLSAYCSLTVTEISEERIPKDPSPAQIAGGLAAEGKKILSALSKPALKIALCIEGESLTSPGLAKLMEDAAKTGEKGVCFVIGGSHGLSDDVKNACDRKLSVSPMTFPHQLFRVLLLEQIYRGFTIVSGGKYHK